MTTPFETTLVCPLFVTFEINGRRAAPPDFRQRTRTPIDKGIQSLDWDALLFDKDIDEAWQIWERTFMSISVFPRVSCQNKRNCHGSILVSDVKCGNDSCQKRGNCHGSLLVSDVQCGNDYNVTLRPVQTTTQQNRISQPRRDLFRKHPTGNSGNLSNC